ncbi:FAD-binding oxidoreductase [Peribacillus psychrosaccharolyticus]|uniref:FAD-binding protein n=1 Tax=Peribacillus psychrosaccharolyticus TaxID=1407 RepID=UPI003D2C7EC5
MKKIFVLISYLVIFALSVTAYQAKLSSPIAEDKGHLLPVALKSIASGTTDQELQQLVKTAGKNDDKLSIAGMQHSQGGQTLYPDAIMVDMKPYNKILSFNPGQKTITVQSGATWDDIQKYINPYHLALKVTQSQNIFTVGGSLSVNVHGRDIRHHALIETVQSFRLLTAEGSILQVSRQENQELFTSVIGGYGLFGIILDVTLELTDDKLYQYETKEVNYREYDSYFTKEVLANDQVKMHLARISVAPVSFLTDMYLTNYLLAPDQTRLEDYDSLKRDSIIALPKFFLGLARINDSGKNTFWNVQRTYTMKTDGKLISRNNSMRSDSTFMDYDHASKTETLQEYFVPVNEFADYIDDLRSMLEKEKDFNLLNITVRYVEKNEEAVMSYAKEDMFALVMLINQGTSKKAVKETEAFIQKMIDLTLAHQGSYYLPYYSYPSSLQLREAYPRTEEFFKLKQKYDPEERFMNLFYKEYQE